MNNFFDKKRPLLYSLTVLFVLSVLLTFLSHVIEKKNKEYKKIGAHDYTTITINVLMIRFVHYFMTFFFVFYYFLFNEKYDFIYLVLYTLLIFHWIVMNDCFLSSLEMLYYKKKINGMLSPQYFSIFFGKYTNYLVIIPVVILFIGLIQIIKRLTLEYSKYLLFFIFFIFQSYLMIHDNIKFLLRTKILELMHSFLNEINYVLNGNYNIAFTLKKK